MRARTAILACASCLVAAPAAGAATAQQTINRLNAQRTANGIPAGITEDPALTSGCALHDHYMALNHVLTHVEDPHKPGYTSAGANAGQNAVLAQGLNWDHGNPYESAPLHLDQLLAPRLVRTGSADAQGFSCTTTFPGWTRPNPVALSVYTYPGNGARIYPSETASEFPQTPGQLAGLSAGATTGPNLIVLVDAPGQQPIANPAALNGATLTGPSGPVAVRTVDGYSPDPNGGSLKLGNYISPGGFIIPVSPLSASTTYRAHVVVGFAGLETVHNWSFTTTAANPHAVFTVTGSRISFRSRSQAPLTVRFSRSGGGHVKPVRVAPGSSVRVPRLRSGRWTVCGHESASGAYAAFNRCLTITVGHVPTLSLGTPSAHNGTVTFPLHFSSVLRGRRATLTVTQLTVVSCTGSRCRTRDGHLTRTQVTLRRGSLGFPAPAAGRGLRVLLRTAAFRVGRTQWSSAQATGEYARP